MLSHWECYALAIAGVGGFVLQQVSLGTGRLAPSVATVSVANPVVGILIGILLLDERLSRPAWHVVLAVIGLGLALVGAVVISLATRGGQGGTVAGDRRRRRLRRDRPDRRRAASAQRCDHRATEVDGAAFGDTLRVTRCGVRGSARAVTRGGLTNELD